MLQGMNEGCVQIILGNCAYAFCGAAGWAELARLGAVYMMSFLMRQVLPAKVRSCSFYFASCALVPMVQVELDMRGFTL